MLLVSHARLQQYPLSTVRGIFIIYFIFISKSCAVDLTALPNNAPNLMLSAPTPTTPAFIAVSLAFTAVFFLTFTLTSFRHKLGKLEATLDKPLVHRLSAWLGFFGFFVGMTRIR